MRAFVNQLEVTKSKNSELLQLQAKKGINKSGLEAQSIQIFKLEIIRSQLSYYKSVK